MTAERTSEERLIDIVRSIEKIESFLRGRSVEDFSNDDAS